MITKERITELLADEYTKNTAVHKIHPRVSVSILAYNHEKFIEAAIESVLSQEVDFDYEIVIGEDCSLDDTRRIVSDYQKKYPDKIRLYLSKRPLNDRKSGQLNFVRNLKGCRGKYIALLDGDDYWSSPYKLQKQVSFLDNYPECALCFHPVAKLCDEGSETQQTLYPSNKKQFYTFEDLLKGNFIATCSTMLRNKLFQEFPDWYFQVAIGDWPLHLLNAQHGQIGYLDEVMAVYRMHRGGMCATRGVIQNYLGIIKCYRFFYSHFDRKYRRLIKSRISNCYHCLAIAYEEQQQRSAALLSFFKCMLVSPACPPVPYRRLLNEILRCSSPRLLGVLALCKSRLTGR